MKHRTRDSIYGMMAAMFGLSAPRMGANPWKQIIFRTITPHILSDEQRAERRAHRKANRQKRQARILRRGFA